MTEWIVCVILNLKVAGSNLRRRRVFANSWLIYTFLIVICKAALCRVLASVCKAKHRLCVKLYLSEPLIIPKGIISKNLSKKFKNYFQVKTFGILC